MGFSREKECKSLVNMAFKIATCLGSVNIVGPFDQTQYEIMDCGQNATGRTDSHTCTIFMKSDIAAIMQARFNQPMLPSDVENFSWRSQVSRQAGNAVFDFRAGFVNLTLADPGEITFEAIDLSETRPIAVIIKHGAGLDRAFFKASMANVDLCYTQEIRCF